MNEIETFIKEQVQVTGPDEKVVALLQECANKVAQESIKWAREQIARLLRDDPELFFHGPETVIKAVREWGE